MNNQVLQPRNIYSLKLYQYFSKLYKKDKETNVYIYRIAYHSGQYVQREFPAWPHSSVRTQSNRAILLWTYTIFSCMSHSSPLDSFLLHVCISSCLLLRADIYLPHPPAIGGGLGPRRWLTVSILLGRFPGGLLPSSYLESEELL